MMIVQENIIDYLNRKYHDGILQSKSAYAIMPIGKNDRSAHAAQRKAPEVATPGLFYSVLGRWLKPKAGYQLFLSVQPFANVVGNYTRQNREKK